MKRNRGVSSSTCSVCTHNSRSISTCSNGSSSSGSTCSSSNGLSITMMAAVSYHRGFQVLSNGTITILHILYVGLNITTATMYAESYFVNVTPILTNYLT